MDGLRLHVIFETSNVLDMGEAEKILEKISSKWSWDKGRISACSEINDPSIIFLMKA